MRSSNCASSATLMACLLLLSISASARAEDGDTLTKARSIYYAAKERGLKGFQCAAIPNWAVVLGDLMASNPAQAKSAIAKLEQLKFIVKAGPDIATEVTHNTLKAENEKQANGLKQVYSGMEQELSGFFQTYSAFMFTRPIPEPGVPFDLKPQGDAWLLSFKEGETSVSEKLDKDYVIEDMTVKGTDFQGTIKPSFKKTGGLLLLTSYQATYDNGNAGQKTDLHVDVEHQVLGDFVVPQKLGLNGSYGTGKFASEVTFAECQLVK